MADSPHFPNSLRYIREQRRLSLEALAKEIGTSATKLEKIEEGASAPTLRQLSLLSQILGASDYEISDPKQPKLESILADLRTPTVTPLSISPKGLKAFFAKSGVAAIIETLARSLQFRPQLFRPPEITSDNLLDRIDDIQNIVDFDPKDNKWVKDLEHTWRHLRYKVEQFGVYVFLAEVPPEDYRGLFAKLDDGVDFILINKRTFKTKARLFTLIHEFAHYLIDRQGISDPLIINNNIESTCNQFASRFLAPSELVYQLVGQIGRNNPSTDSLVTYVSDRCLLSKGATAYRLREERLITKEQYQQWFVANGMPTQYGREATDDEINNEEDGGGGGKYAYTIVSNYGLRPFQILQTALRQGAIDDVHVAQIINVRGETQELAFKTAISRVAELSQ